MMERFDQNVHFDYCLAFAFVVVPFSNSDSFTGSRLLLLISSPPRCFITFKTTSLSYSFSKFFRSLRRVLTYILHIQTCLFRTYHIKVRQPCFIYMGITLINDDQFQSSLLRPPEEFQMTSQLPRSVIQRRVNHQTIQHKHKQPREKARINN